MIDEGRWIFSDASAVILAGGQSSRMGYDKMMLPINGQTMIRHILDQLRGHFYEIVISSNDRRKLAFLGVDVVPDKEPGQGPLMGIVSALEVVKNEKVFVVACDIPNIDMDFVGRMFLESSEYDCVVPKTGTNKLEPLFAVYRKSVINTIEEMLKNGQRKASDLFSKVKVKYLEMGKTNWFRNLNTIDELNKYKQKWNY